MTSAPPKKVSKPFTPEPGQKWFSFFCDPCSLYFKIDCHDNKASCLKNMCCPLCHKKAQRKGGPK